MPRLDYAAAIKAGKTPQEIKAFVDAQNASGNRLEVVNIVPGISAPRKPGALDRAAGVASKFMGGLAGFTGLDKAGESLGRLGLQLSDVGNKAAGVKQSTFNVPRPSGKQIAGDVLTLGGTGVALAAPGSTLARREGANAAAAGMLGTGKGLQDGHGVGQAVGTGLAKGAVAGGVTGALGLLGKVAAAATKKVPLAVYKSSVRVPNKTDASVLLDEGLVGSREALKGKVGNALDASEAVIQKNPEFQAAKIDPGEVFNNPEVRRLQRQANALGRLKAWREPTDRLLVQKPSMTGPEILELRRAIDETTPVAGMQGRSKELSTRTENAIADSLRGLLADAAPTAAGELKRQSSFLDLQKALKAYDDRQTSPVPYGVGNFLQRTLLTPALGTRMASAGRKTGKALDRAGMNIIVQALKRAGRVGGVTGLGGL